VIKKFEYNPQNKVCRRSYVFLTKSGPVIMGVLTIVSIVMSITTYLGFFFPAILFGVILIGFLTGKKSWPKSIIIDFERNKMSVITFGGLTSESPLSEVKFKFAGIYSGRLVIIIGKEAFKYFELLEGGEIELWRILIKNCKQVGLSKMTLEDLKHMK